MTKQLKGATAVPQPPKPHPKPIPLPRPQPEPLDPPPTNPIPQVPAPPSMEINAHPANFSARSDVATQYRWSFPHDLKLAVRVSDTGETSLAIERSKAAAPDERGRTLSVSEVHREAEPLDAVHMRRWCVILNRVLVRIKALYRNERANS
jgi:hypothetical protein